MDPVERIAKDGRTLAYVIRAGYSPDRTAFPTPEEENLQVGFVVYPAGGAVEPHVHRPVERHVIGTAEALVVRKGRCLVDFYDDREEPVTTCELIAGDVVLLVAGGHGIRMLEDTVLLEVKQGPYTGLGEKRRFSPR